MGKPRLKLVAPAIVNRTVTPSRRPNRDLRTREDLTVAEVERLMPRPKATDTATGICTMVLLAYRHGLRVAELVDLLCGSRWSSKWRSCTSGGSRLALLAATASWG